MSGAISPQVRMLLRASWLGEPDDARHGAPVDLLSEGAYAIAREATIAGLGWIETRRTPRFIANRHGKARIEPDPVSAAIEERRRRAVHAEAVAIAAIVVALAANAVFVLIGGGL